MGCETIAPAFMTADRFRKMALAMSGAIESAHMNHPDFRVGGRIFATLSGDAKRGMVSLTPEQQRRFLAEQPGTFEPGPGAWGRGGSTMVRLAQADDEAVGEAMTLAWQGAVAKGPTRSAKKKPAKQKPARQGRRR